MEKKFKKQTSSVPHYGWKSQPIIHLHSPSHPPGSKKFPSANEMKFMVRARYFWRIRYKKLFLWNLFFCCIHSECIHVVFMKTFLIVHKTSVWPIWSTRPASLVCTINLAVKRKLCFDYSLRLTANLFFLFSLYFSCSKLQ